MLLYKQKKRGAPITIAKWNSNFKKLLIIFVLSKLEIWGKQTSYVTFRLLRKHITLICKCQIPKKNECKKKAKIYSLLIEFWKAFVMKIKLFIKTKKKAKI